MPCFDWTLERVQFLKANYHSIGRTGIAELWGVAPIVIGRKAHAMGISEPRGALQAKAHAERRMMERIARPRASDRANHRYDWTPERLAKLKAEYADKGAAHFAELWGMTQGTITQRAHRMGLTRGQKGGPRPGMSIARLDRDPGYQQRRQQVRQITTQMEAHVGKRGDAQEIADRIAARKAPDRLCAWREVGNGFLRSGKPCGKLAVPGRMWCECCQARVDALKAVA
jgi:hypothetical protein